MEQNTLDKCLHCKMKVCDVEDSNYDKNQLVVCHGQHCAIHPVCATLFLFRILIRTVQ